MFWIDEKCITSFTAGVTSQHHQRHDRRVISLLKTVMTFNELDCENILDKSKQKLINDEFFEAVFVYASFSGHDHLKAITSGCDCLIAASEQMTLSVVAPEPQGIGGTCPPLLQMPGHGGKEETDQNILPIMKALTRNN